MRIYRSGDLSENLLLSQPIAVIGYGNQGHAHALNLLDSGARVIVGAREGGSGWRRAEKDGFKPRPVPDAVCGAKAVAILLPDEVQGEVFAEEIEPNLEEGAALIFAHGFAIAFGEITPPEGCDALLVAPKGQGDYLRKMYVRGEGLPCLVGAGPGAGERAKEKALSYAALLGCLRAGAIETTFREEAVTDLFGEQVVLCGGVPALVKAAFETLVDKGYSSEVAYLECLHELKIITDLMHEGGIANMRRLISGTAAWGSFTAQDEVVTPAVKAGMKKVLEAIEEGRFAADWMKEAGAGRTRLRAFLEDEADHEIEKAGERVRSLMPYLRRKH